MKASELIHGGLYLIHDSSDIVVRYDITSNSFRSEWYEYPLALFHDDVCATDGDRYIFVKPIPLTEEILKANGFEYKSEIDGWHINMGATNGFRNRVIVFPNKKHQTIFIENNMEHGGSNSLQMFGEYVHILQHALRLCGLNSLADNLKIK